MAVIEVGLGGLLDSTNTLSSPLCSVIVNIGLDHMDRLGSTLPEIARQKAGIIKPKGWVFTAENRPECLAVFEEVCQTEHAQLIRSLPYTVEENSTASQLQLKIGDLRLTLATAARYQAANAALACTVLQWLNEKKILSLSRDQLQQGFLKARWPGRFEKVAERPLTILDGAHNVPGIEALIDSLTVLPQPRIVVFTALKDKQTQAMACELQRHCDQLIITEFDYFRAQKGALLEVPGSRLNLNWQSAIFEGRQAAGDHGSLVITGSLYFISEVRAWLVGHE